MANWHRIVVDDFDGSASGRFVTAGERLMFSGGYKRGMSIWAVARMNAVGAGIIGTKPSERVKNMPSRRTEIYLSPGTLEAMDPRDLADYNVEPCDRPLKDDVALLVGDQSDWTNLWR